MTTTDSYRSLPAACVICGSVNDLQSRTISRTFTPGWVYLTLPFGLLPAALFALLFQVKHKMSLRVCPTCRTRRAWAGVVHPLAILSCLALIFVAIALGILYESWLVFLGVSAVTAAIAYASGKFDARANPRYTVFMKDTVEIEIPGHGRYVVIPDWSLAEAFVESKAMKESH